jgi:protein-glutamine gamma-glutamyltransferase
VVLVGWALLTLRSRQRPLVVWLVLFAALAGAGFGGHHGIIGLQRKLEAMNINWFTPQTGGFSDREVRTRLGAIGRLKNSDRIVLRLTTDGSGAPELLREMSFNSYRTDGGNWAFWSVAQRDFGSIFSDADQTTWPLLPRKLNARRVVNIAGYFRNGTGLMPLPAGSAEVANLAVTEMATNQFGAVKMSGGPGMAIYDARFGDGATMDSAWTTNDLVTPDDKEPLLAGVAAELQLTPGLPPAEAVRRVRAFFAEKFQYTSQLTREHAARRGESALARFLLTTRSGHCEYFATATTLLLRYAGVPTRYAVGYSVQEGKGKKYVVRDRHAHAWTLWWDGKTWLDLDTTPSSWDATEAADTSWFQPVKDFFSDLWFQFSKFRWGQTEWRKWFMLAPVPLLIVVLVRFFFGKSWKERRARNRAQANALARAGVDSEFYRVEKHFAARGLERGASENWSDWLRRVDGVVEGGRLKVEGSTAGNLQLNRLLTLHQRHRFDPRGLDASERAALREEVSRWLATRN